MPALMKDIMVKVAQTDRQTDTQNDYRNPRCACAPRVNNYACGIFFNASAYTVYTVYNIVN